MSWSIIYLYPPNNKKWQMDKENYVNTWGSCTINFEFFPPRFLSICITYFYFFAHVQCLWNILIIWVYLSLSLNILFIQFPYLQWLLNQWQQRRNQHYRERQNKRYERKPFLLSLWLSVLVSRFSQYSQIFPCGQVRREDVISASNNTLLYKLTWWYQELQKKRKGPVYITSVFCYWEQYHHHRHHSHHSHCWNHLLISLYELGTKINISHTFSQF